MAKREGGGYGKPPEATRWKPGQSGNPKGAPKKVSRQSLARAALDRRVTVVERGVRKRITVEELGLRALADKAAAGNLKALDYLRAAATTETGIETSNDELSPIDEAILGEALERLGKKGRAE